MAVQEEGFLEAVKNLASRTIVAVGYPSGGHAA
jgi:hypothetical protein